MKTIRRCAARAAAALSALTLLALSGAVQAQQWAGPDSGGNIGTTNGGAVGIGSTFFDPWGNVFKVVAVGPDKGFTIAAGNTSGNAFHFTDRAYYDGSTWRYSASSSPVSNFYIGGGLFGVRVAPAGAQGAPLSWRTALFVNNSGSVGFGTTSPDTVAHFVMSNADTNIESGVTASHGLTLSNSDATPNNYTSLMFSDGAGQGTFAGLFGVATDHANNYGDMALLTRGSGGYRERLRVTSGGNVGVGTSAPSARLDVSSVAAAGANNFPLVVANRNTAADARTGILFQDNALAAAYGAFIRVANNGADGGGDMEFGSVVGGAYSTRLFVRASDGNVGIGTASPTQRLEVAGGVRVSKTAAGTGGDLSVEGAITGGTISATYQDVAEWVPSAQKLAAGTVVILDAVRANHVVASRGAYDTKVAGVVSAEPGVILGVPGEGKVKVATTGRVRVRVDATRGAISVGDLLVTSGAEGAAMKSVAVDLGGVRIHRPGTIIGKALEPLEGGVGEILVLLSLQ